MAFIEDLLTGGATNLLSNGINYAFQTMAANKNYQLAEQSAENQYQRQLDFWHMQNAYNTPKMQVGRRLAAGLSPVENVDSGNSSQLSTVPGNDVGKSGALQFQSSIDLLDSMRTVQEIRNLGKTGNRLDAEISNLIADGFLKELDKQLKDAGLTEMAERLESVRIANERERRANKHLYTDDYYAKSLETFLANLKKISAEGNIADKNWNTYNITGINPSVMNKQDMFIINAINTLLSMFGIKLDKSPGILKGLFGN